MIRLVTVDGCRIDNGPRRDPSPQVVQPTRVSEDEYPLPF